MDCLIISYSEPNRNRERNQFFYEPNKEGSGWGRFLHLNYIAYDGDIVLPNQLASIANAIRLSGKAEKSEDGFFKTSDISRYSAWKIPPLGGLFLYQYLKRLHFDVGIVQHAQLERDRLDGLLEQKPKVIAISTTLILNPLDISALVQYCRSRSPESFIVLGGQSIWSRYLSNPQHPDQFRSYRADAVVLDSKGFKTLGRIVGYLKNNQNLRGVPNLVLYAGNGAEPTTVRPETYDFAEDAIRWDLIDDYLLDRVSLMRTAISCPFKCAFCSYPSTQGHFVKSSIEMVQADLQALANRGVKYLLFTDDTFNFPKNRFDRLLSALKRHDFVWYAFIRCQYLDKQLVKKMKESGCAGAYLGLESANDDMLRGMNKKATTDDFLRGVELLASEGITTLASFVIGFPGETDRTIEDTKEFVENSGIDYYNVKIFYYEHCAPIFNSRSEFDLVGQGMNWRHTTMSSSEAFEKTEAFIRDVKKVPYIPQHSGEIWEIAHFQEHGIPDHAINLLYREFTQMLRNSLSNSPLPTEDIEKVVLTLGKYF